MLTATESESINTYLALAYMLHVVCLFFVMKFCDGFANLSRRRELLVTGIVSVMEGFSSIFSLQSFYSDSSYQRLLS